MCKFDIRLIDGYYIALSIGAELLSGPELAEFSCRSELPGSFSLFQSPGSSAPIPSLDLPRQL